MILRRAARFGKLIGFEGPFLAQIAETVIDMMGGHYTDLVNKRDFILQTITEEEERFHRTLTLGLGLLDDLMNDLRAAGKSEIAGKDAFRLWDTYGFPVDLTRDVAGDAGFTVDEAGFRAALNEAKERSRETAQEKTAADLSVYGALLADLKSQGLVDEEGVKHLIYENAAEVDTQIIGLLVNGQRVEEVHAGDTVEIVLPETPFYAESGGQVSDTGEIYFFPEEMEEPAWVVEVTDTRRRIPGLIVHVGTVTSGSLRVGDPAQASIDTDRRWDIMRNHTGTHVLHAVLRHRLGNHAHQAGSLVAPERLRFDFTHSQPVSKEELADMERLANEIILTNYTVNTRWTSYKQAVKEGAMALFGEKYGDVVRVVSVGDWARELCGGTHVARSGQLGVVKLLGESSIGAGVRRVEALVGVDAYRFLAREHILLNSLTDLIKGARTEELPERIADMLNKMKEIEKELAAVRSAQALSQAGDLGKSAQDVNGFTFIGSVMSDGVSGDDLRKIAIDLRAQHANSVVALVSSNEGKPVLVVAISDDARAKGVKAGALVKIGSTVLGGGGGGKDDFAQGGGTNPEKSLDAIAAISQSLLG
jgi:alanyl-tRNA synthetase